MGLTATGEPRISVVIPTFNRAELAVRAVKSVLDQTSPATEVLVIDDGSTDDTAGQMLAFGSQLRYVHQPNQGASAARNRGLREASAEWVAFLDSDDIWLPTHLERIGAAIRGTQGAGIFYFDDMERTTDEGGGTLWEFSGFSIEGAFCLVNDATSWVLREWLPMMLQSTVFHREGALASGGFLETIRTGEDTHMFLKLGLGGSACAVAGCGTRQTADDLPGNRLSQAFNSRTRDRWHNNIKLCTDILGQKPLLSQAVRRLIRHRIADSHWRLSRMAWQEGRVAACLQEAVVTMATQPAYVFTLLRGLHTAGRPGH